VLILLDIDKVVNLEDLGETAAHAIGSPETAEDATGVAPRAAA